MGKPKIGPEADALKAKKALAKKPATAPVTPDEIDDSRAPLLDHLLELRNRLIKIMIAMALAFGICFYFSETLFEWLLVPYEIAQGRLVEKGFPTSDLIYTKALGAFFVKLKIALFGAVVLAFPVLAYHVYRFIAPGLYKNERGAFLPYLFASPFLFIAGASLVFFFVFPFVLEFGLKQQFSTESTSVKPLLDAMEYLSLAMTLFLVFGLSFQLPVIISLLARAGILRADSLRKARRYAIVGIAAFGAIATPPDPFSQIGLGLALYALYEISIICASMVEPKDEADAGAQDAA